MSFLADNIRFLRNGKRYSQQRLADELIISRSRLAKYEDGRSEPPIDVLLRISTFFKISVDSLLVEELNKKVDTK